MNVSSQMAAFQEILDPLSLDRTLDMNRVRAVCEKGIPDQPPWIRPRVWKLLLGTLPPEKDRWPTESTKSRERYYDLATEFLDEVERMPEPTYPLAPRDKLLDTISKDVARTQPRVPFFRSFVEPSPFNPLTPLPHGYVFKPSEEDGDEHEHPPPPRIESAGALWERLDLIERTASRVKNQRKESTIEVPKTPEIRLSPSMDGEKTADGDDEDEGSSGSDEDEEEEDDEEESGEDEEEASPSKATQVADSLGLSINPTAAQPVTPTLSVTSPTSPHGHSSSQLKEGIELVSSQPLPKPVPRHSQVLLRILYLFSVTHPHQPYTQGLNELLAPLYYAMCSDLDERESVHAEADAFWMFSELIGEVGAVVGEPGDWRNQDTVDITILAPGGSGAASNGVKGAMAELSSRLKWADLQLWEDLHRKSLDPRLPYYSYRWIACLLAQDLPLEATLRVWDSIFSQPPSTPDSNPRISFLISICTSMLIRLRHRLIKTGNMATKSGGLWDDEYIDADEVLASKGVPPTVNTDAEGVMGEGFVEGMVLLQAYPVKTIGVDMIISGARELVYRMQYEDEQRRRGPSAVVTVGAKLRERILNGITNRTAIDEEEESEESEDDEGDATEKETSTKEGIDKAAAQATPSLPAANAATRIRQAAASLADSDAAAQLSKASTNWRVAALDAWNKGSLAAPPTAQAPAPQRPLPRRDSAAGSQRSASPADSVGSNSQGQGHQKKPSLSGQAASTRFWQVAEAIRTSDAAAQLNKTTTNLTAAAMDRWNKPSASSPLNPSTPSPTEDSSHSRGNSLGSWSGWGAVKASAFWGGVRAPQTPTSEALSPTWTPSDRNGRDTRTSLPVPLRGREPANAHNHRRSPSSSPGFTSPEKPKYFANPRDSFAGFNNPTDMPDPLQEALMRARMQQTETPEQSPEEGGSLLGKGLQNALATLTGSRPPSPPPAPKSAPRPLLLGTPAAKTVSTSPSPKAPSKSLDSRPSSISSNASVLSTGSTSQRSVTPTPTARPMPESPSASVSTPSDPERKQGSGFVTLRNGVGRTSGSTALMRKSRAAHPRGKHSTEENIPDVPPLPVSIASPVSDAGSEPIIISSPLVLEPSVKKYSLTDAPAPVPTPLARGPAPLAPATDGYSSAGSGTGAPIPRNRLRAKRQYQPKGGHALRVQTAPESADDFGMLHRREGAGSEGGLQPHAGGASPLTPQGDGLKTPTSGNDEKRPKSPRRVKKVPSRERPKSVTSDGDGERADDEDGYGDLLSAYSEDDATGSRKSIAI